MARHADLRIRHGLPVRFCDPQSPWQRGTDENTSGLLRQYFPKGTDLAAHDPGELDAVAAALNGRPRKTPGWRTPAEALDELLHKAQDAGVATNGWDRVVSLRIYGCLPNSETSVSDTPNLYSAFHPRLL